MLLWTLVLEFVVGASLVLVETLTKPFQVVSVVFHSPCLIIINTTLNNDDTTTIELVGPTLVCSGQISVPNVKSSRQTTGTTHITFPYCTYPLPSILVFPAARM